MPDSRSRPPPWCRIDTAPRHPRTSAAHSSQLVFFATGRATTLGRTRSRHRSAGVAMNRMQKFLLAAVAIGAVVGLSGRLHADELTIGTIGASSDAPFFVA